MSSDGGVVSTPTIRHYWHDDHCLETGARVVAASHAALAFDRTVFYPGGGGQPCDHGTLQWGGTTATVSRVASDEHGVIWHGVDSDLSGVTSGCPALMRVDAARRMALTRYHTVLHVLNTIALRDYNGWITGVQIGVDYSRIDFKFDDFSSALRDALEFKVNEVLAESHPLRSSFLEEIEFRQRPELLRTLEAQPPIVGGKVRVVEIEGFDAQACGGTHVRHTGEVGCFSIFKTENKGRVNKRLYIRLE
jgi:misacylated tRNA(Ala) deacylase